MEENEIIRGELKNPIEVFMTCMLFPIIGALIPIFYNYSIATSYYQKQHNGGKPNFAYAFSLSNGVNYAFYPIIIVLLIIGIVIFIRWSNVQITVTDKRVFGNNSAGKRVDLPLDTISAVGTSAFSALAVTAASGVNKFTMLKNRDEIQDAISKLLIQRQNKEKTVSQTTIKQEIQQSNADELRKYKELLDSGTITQEEFDAKKKQLLGV